MAAAIRGRRSVPCVLVVELPAADDAQEGASLATMHMYRAGGKLMSSAECGWLEPKAC